VVKRPCSSSSSLLPTEKEQGGLFSLEIKTFTPTQYHVAQQQVRELSGYTVPRPSLSCSYTRRDKSRTLLHLDAYIASATLALDRYSSAPAVAGVCFLRCASKALYTAVSSFACNSTNTGFAGLIWRGLQACPLRTACGTLYLMGLLASTATEQQNSLFVSSVTAMWIPSGGTSSARKILPPGG